MSSHSPSFPSSPTSQIILQPFRRFAYATAHFLTPPLLHLAVLILQVFHLHLRHSSFSNPSVAAHSPTFPLLHIALLIVQAFRLHLRHSSFFNRYFTYVTAHSPTLPLLHLALLIL